MLHRLGIPRVCRTTNFFYFPLQSAHSFRDTRLLPPKATLEFSFSSYPRNCSSDFVPENFAAGCPILLASPFLSWPFVPGFRNGSLITPLFNIPRLSVSSLPRIPARPSDNSAGWNLIAGQVSARTSRRQRRSEARLSHERDGGEGNVGEIRRLATRLSHIFFARRTRRTMTFD